MRTRLVALVGLGLLALACGAPGGGEDPTPGPGMPTADFDLSNVPYTSVDADYVIAGDIVADDTWSGDIVLTERATIMPGVTIDIAPGSNFLGFPDATLVVRGTFNVQGEVASRATLGAYNTGQRWGGILMQQGASTISHADITEATAAMVCEAGATSCDFDNVTIRDVRYAIQISSSANISYATIEDMANGGMNILAGANVVITDSVIRSSTADIFIIAGGNLSIDYSEIGGAQYEHCALHFSDVGSFSLTNSDVTGNVYGFMIRNTTDATINGNNFTQNSTTHMGDYGGNINVDATGNYWEGGLPAINDPEFDFSNMAGGVIAGTGPR